jgi:hypothetical protein
MGEWLPRDCCELTRWKRLRAPPWDIPLLRAVGFLQAYLRVRQTQTSVSFLPCHNIINPFTASCENAMTLSARRPASCEKFPHSSRLNFWSTESIFNQFSVFLKTLNALCVCLQYKHPRSIKRVIRSDKPVTLLLLLRSHECDIGAEPRSRIIATSAVKGLSIVISYRETPR